MIYHLLNILCNIFSTSGNDVIESTRASITLCTKASFSTAVSSDETTGPPKISFLLVRLCATIYFLDTTITNYFVIPNALVSIFRKVPI